MYYIIWNGHRQSGLYETEEAAKYRVDTEVSRGAMGTWQIYRECGTAPVYVYQLFPQ